MGVSHIYIIEDIDSAPHNNIIAKYNQKVTLWKGENFLDTMSLKTIQRLKQTKLLNPQVIYFKTGLTKLKEAGVYDWCFILDADEFLTLENPEENLDTLMQAYENWDAILIQWKYYGANGRIHMPDYSKITVQEAFPNPAVNDMPGKRQNSLSKKIAYNLRRYKNEFWRGHAGVHQPADGCNFCNTEFRQDRKERTYKHLYIRHYITKSWEEYAWKKLHRGYFMGFRRTFDAFFHLNPDLKPYEDELISQIEGETLVVLPYARGGGQGRELEIALTSWKRFCKSKYKFIVIGDADESLKQQFDWVEFIDMPRVPSSKTQYTPHLDMQHKMETVYNLYKDQYPGFIWMVDDDYAVRPFYIYELKNIYIHATTFTGDETTPTWFWKHDKWKTKQLLSKEHFPCRNYTTHFPCYFEFGRLKEIWDKYNLREESYVVEDIYFNSYEHEIFAKDDSVRVALWKKEHFQEKFPEVYENPNIKFVNNSVEGWSKELEDVLLKIANGEIILNTEPLPSKE